MRVYPKISMLAVFLTLLNTGGISSPADTVAVDSLHAPFKLIAEVSTETKAMSNYFSTYEDLDRRCYFGPDLFLSSHHFAAFFSLGRKNHKTPDHH